MISRDPGGERRAQEAEAAERFAARADARAETRQILARPSGILAADTPQRIAKRIDRLSRYYAREPLPVVPSETPDEDPGPALAESLGRMARTAGTPEEEALAAPTEAAAGIVFEAVINRPDFLDIRFPRGRRDRGARGLPDRDPRRPRAPGRVRDRLAALAAAAADQSPRASERGGRASQRRRIQLPGRPRRAAAQLKGLPPRAGQLLHRHRERDFALVAVAAEPGLGEFGFNRLIEAENKAIVGEYVTIVQHPSVVEWRNAVSCASLRLVTGR